MLASLLLSVAAAQDEDDETPELLPGLVAVYTGADGRACTRRDAAVQFAWSERPPDPRISPGEFTAAWRGKLLVVAPGSYRLQAFVAGEVQVDLAGETLMRGSAAEPRWIDSPPIELEFGHHDLRVTYRKTAAAARVGLYWSGPQFQLEPLPEWALCHDPSAAPDERFEQGRRLSRALRCAACHESPGAGPPTPAPSLSRLDGNLMRTWLIDRLTRPEVAASGDMPTAANDGARSQCMPSFDLTADEAQAVADYLLSTSRGIPTDAAPKGNRAKGERLFLTLGCLACHRLGELGSWELFSGGDLSRVAEKRPAGFFARWLEAPQELNPAHRMPIFPLQAEERNDLAAFLATLGGDRPSQVEADARPERKAQGRRLVEQLRCGACHELPEKAAAAPRLKLASFDDGQNSCLAGPGGKSRRPGYRLSAAERGALVAYFTAVPPTARPEPLDGPYVLAERSCLACHARGLSRGIAETLDRLSEAHPELAPLLPALAPPALNAVGDKLRDDALLAAVTLRRPPLRPWLAIRMPRFALSAQEIQAITDYLIAADRIPDRPAEPPSSTDASSRSLAGGRLVTSDGFGCTSCHQIGKSVPRQVALAARGTDLSLVGQRIRPSWFDRWVRNPGRIVPRMEMPAIQTPVRGVLADRLGDQLSAVWHVLNQPGFNPPPPGAVRTVRRRNVAELAEPAVVLTDVLEVSERPFLRPLVVGLANRHNVLFDLAANRLAGWWIGDTARQRTRGKSWYWEPGGSHLAAAPQPGGQPEMTLLGLSREADEPLSLPGRAELDWFAQVPDGVQFGYRIQSETLALSVVQTITAVGEGGAEGGGFRRRLEIRGAPSGCAVRLRVVPADWPTKTVNGALVFDAAASQSQIRIVQPACAEPAITRDGASVVLHAEASDRPLVCQFEYRSTLPVDRFPVAPPLPSAPPPAPLRVVPGYEVVRLPLPADEMPTGLTWRADGGMAFCSIKGSVWLAHDSDGDGIEDRQTLFADGLPAPYGIAAHGADLDVCAKLGLVRLADRDGDGQADRCDVVASGWGYTTDYHDWTVGLPRDGEGNYYVALPCQQDDRASEAAYLRGTAVKLVPRDPTAGDPRAYRIEPICSGLRFPMGLAVNRRGDLFATDNQGNYTPFNELNHLVAGERYGFINKVEQRPGFRPPFREPAINIPHPWTRSVNGICFLDTPDAVRSATGRHLFGPFEGHLIGCEFDTRRLIRMSLERVGDTYQGAAYPFSVEPDAGGETFEGPVVCAVAPDGDVYVGNLRDSGWGGGRNTGSLVRLRPSGELPCGMAEVRATPDGFTIDFTRPVDPPAAVEAGNYAISSYRRIATPAYGGEDIERESERIASIDVASDARRVTLHLTRLRPGSVYEFRLKRLAAHGRPLFPAEAYYTLRNPHPSSP